MVLLFLAWGTSQYTSVCEAINHGFKEGCPVWHTCGMLTTQWACMRMVAAIVTAFKHDMGLLNGCLTADICVWVTDSRGHCDIAARLGQAKHPQITGSNCCCPHNMEPIVSVTSKQPQISHKNWPNLTWWAAKLGRGGGAICSELNGPITFTALHSQEISRYVYFWSVHRHTLSCYVSQSWGRAGEHQWMNKYSVMVNASHIQHKLELKHKLHNTIDMEVSITYVLFDLLIPNYISFRAVSFIAVPVYNKTKTDNKIMHKSS